MAGIDENRTYWADYDWPKGGDEWSRPWGGTPSVWYGVLLPRLHRWLPAGTVLEIGAGFGRWTDYLRNVADRVIAVDIVEKCVAHCRQRFADSNVESYVNDGQSLSMVLPDSVDLVFSYDSLVHCDATAIGAYLREFARVLTPNGIGFVHHSNIGVYAAALRRGHRLNRRVNRWVSRLGITAVNGSWRAEDMTAERFAALSREAGLVCIAQEILPWGPAPPLLRDCLSTFTRGDSIWARPNRVRTNWDFLREQRYLAERASLYAPDR